METLVEGSRETGDHGAGSGPRVVNSRCAANGHGIVGIGGLAGRSWRREQGRVGDGRLVEELGTDVWKDSGGCTSRDVRDIRVS